MIIIFFLLSFLRCIYFTDCLAIFTFIMTYILLEFKKHKRSLFRKEIKIEFSKLNLRRVEDRINYIQKRIKCN